MIFSIEYIMAKNNRTSWIDIEGNEDLKYDEELNREKIKLEIEKKIKELKLNQKTVDVNTEETVENMINYLNELQNTEQELYTVLKDENDNTDKKDIINQINDLSGKRDNLYRDLKEMSVSVRNESKNETKSYENQLRLVSIAEKELNREKEKLQILNAEKYNKLRMVEINTYYSKKYEALGYITILVIIIFLVVMLINYLTSINLIPSSVSNSVGPLLIGIGIFILFLAYFDVLKRSNFNFDEYAYPKEDGSSSSSGEIGIWPEPDLGLCIGEACCSSGTEYDTTTDTCKVVSTSKESFIGESQSSNNIVTGFNTEEYMVV